MNEQEFWAALAPLPEPTPPTYRLYYNDLGEPLFYSMEDVSGKYIEIDHATYSNPPTHVRVIDGKLVILKTNFVTKLTPAATGTPCDPLDVSIVVDVTEPHTNWILK
jgi:hypothetical protein